MAWLQQDACDAHNDGSWDKYSCGFDVHMTSIAQICSFSVIPRPFTLATATYIDIYVHIYTVLKTNMMPTQHYVGRWVPLTNHGSHAADVGFDTYYLPLPNNNNFHSLDTNLKGRKHQWRPKPKLNLPYLHANSLTDRRVAPFTFAQCRPKEHDEVEGGWAYESKPPKAM